MGSERRNSSICIRYSNGDPDETVIGKTGNNDRMRVLFVTSQLRRDERVECVSRQNTGYWEIGMTRGYGVV